MFDTLQTWLSCLHLPRNSPLLEISFVQEVQGEVSILEVNGLTDRMIFRISDQAPSPGDECVFFDVLAAYLCFSWWFPKKLVALISKAPEPGGYTSEKSVLLPILQVCFMFDLDDLEM